MQHVESETNATHHLPQISVPLSLKTRSNSISLLTSTACIFQRQYRVWWKKRSSGMRSQVESHPKPTGRRGAGGRGSRDILWNLICITAYLFSRLCRKTCRNFSETKDPKRFRLKHTWFWMITLNYLLSLLSAIRQAMHHQPLSTCFPWLCRFAIQPTRNASDSQPLWQMSHSESHTYSQLTCVSAAEEAGIPETDECKQNSAGGSFW